MSTLQRLSEELFRIINQVLSEEKNVTVQGMILEWENETGKFRYDGEKHIIFVQPKKVAEHLDIKVTILRTGASFDHE